MRKLRSEFYSVRIESDNFLKRPIEIETYVLKMLEIKEYKDKYPFSTAGETKDTGVWGWKRTSLVRTLGPS